MKKKYVKWFVYGLVTVLLASSLTGCSGCKEETKEVASETVVSESVAVSEAVSEIVSEDVSDSASETVSEKPSEAISEPISEVTSEKASEVTSEVISEKPSETASETTSEQASESASEEKVTSEKTSEENSEEKASEESPENTSEKEEVAKPSYTVEPMSATMYAQRAVNVRKGPGTEFEKVGGLSLNQTVTVTGKASTGWYEISYNSTIAYVSGSYLGTEKVVVQNTPPAENTTPSTPAPETPLTPPSSETPAPPAAPPVTETPTQPSVPETPPVVQETPSNEMVIEEVYLEYDMLGMVNELRASEGIDTCTWSDDVSASCMERVKEVATLYFANGRTLSHDGDITVTGNECVAVREILNAGSASDFYNQYVGSPSHFKLLKSGSKIVANSFASATCKVTQGGKTYYFNVLWVGPLGQY